MAEPTGPDDRDTAPVWRGTARARPGRDDDPDDIGVLADTTELPRATTAETRALLPRTTPAPRLVVYPQYVQVHPLPPARPRRSNLLATLSLVFGLAGTAICGLSIAGAIMGHVARRQLRYSDEEGDSVALAGIIVSWVVTVLYVVIGCGGVLLFLSLVERATAG